MTTWARVASGPVQGWKCQPDRKCGCSGQSKRRKAIMMHFKAVASGVLQIDPRASGQNLHDPWISGIFLELEGRWCDGQGDGMQARWWAMYLDQQPGACVLDKISMIQERHEKRRDIEVDEVKGIAKERVNLWQL
jgi:hypothetical protein